jgi:hypothetical protein
MAQHLGYEVRTALSSHSTLTCLPVCLCLQALEFNASDVRSKSAIVGQVCPCAGDTIHNIRVFVSVFVSVSVPVSVSVSVPVSVSVFVGERCGTVSSHGHRRLSKEKTGYYG